MLQIADEARKHDMEVLVCVPKSRSNMKKKYEGQFNFGDRITSCLLYTSSTSEAGYNIYRKNTPKKCKVFSERIERCSGNPINVSNSE